jgi:hypothetical protein
LVVHRGIQPAVSLDERVQTFSVRAIGWLSSGLPSSGEASTSALWSLGSFDEPLPRADLLNHIGPQRTQRLEVRRHDTQKPPRRAPQETAPVRAATGHRRETASQPPTTTGWSKY